MFIVDNVTFIDSIFVFCIIIKFPKIFLFLYQNSTVVKYINNPNFHSSAYPTLESAWKTWNKSGGHIMTGLSNRRNQEWNMFNN